MRAVRYHGPKRPLQLEEVPLPTPEPGEVVVQVKAAGLCHTELTGERTAIIRKAGHLCAISSVDATEGVGGAGELIVVENCFEELKAKVGN